VSPYLLSVLLGIVEGLTEFLPVSSTAHLRIAEAVMKIPLDDPYWQMYTIVIQVGAIFALCLIYLERIAGFVRTFPRGENGDRNWFNHPISLTFFAFVVTSATTLPLRKWSQKNLGSLHAIAIAMLVGGVIMWVVDAWSSRREAFTTHVEQMTFLQAAWIGLCQTASAIFPGTSRSMSTIAAGQLVGMSRAAALEFSFFLSIPTMTVATLFTLLKSLTGKDENPIGVHEITQHQWIILAIGFVVSFIVAYGAVAWFMSWVRKRGFSPFALYRIVLGIAVLAWTAGLIRR
jgi:undecaprenyl-diphosphatase